MTRPPNTVIRASAGTGKTFQLSNRYLELLLRGEPVDRILATTFARKAAGEITERVVLRLAEAVLDPDRCAELAHHAGLDALAPDDCAARLRSLLADQHRMRVGTLDGFFARLAGSFALELDLAPGWRVVQGLEDERLRSDAVRAVLADENVADTVTLLFLLAQGETTRSVAAQVQDLVVALYDLFLETPPEAWSRVPRTASLTGDEVVLLVAALRQVASAPDKRMLKARDTDLEVFLAEDWKKFLSKGLSSKIRAGETTYYSKEIPSALLDPYRELVRHATSLLLRQIADQTEATARLLARYHDEYRRLRRTRRVLRFADVTAVLAAAVADRRLDDPSFRLDARVAHLLLDEFQDTALAQWQVLEPFAHEAAADRDDRSFLCVGDVKQAIYGWRGGLSELFDAVAASLPRIAPRELVRSFRSGPDVIRFVNRLVPAVVECAALDEHPDVRAAWRTRFVEHRTARDTLPGHVTIRTAPDPGTSESDVRWSCTLRHAADLVADLHRRHPGRSIGVLVRRNKAVARLIHDLRRRHDIRASEEGGNPLTDSPAVQLLLSLLDVADHPGHTAARFHVATSPVAEAVGLTDHADDALAARVSLRIRERLASVGYGRTLAEWVHALAPVCDERDLGRLRQLVEAAHAWEPQATPRTRDFRRLVELQRVEDPHAAAVRVMTVHQAKGLQFDLVVLPELDLRLSGQPKKVAVARSSPVRPPDLVCRHVSKDLQPLLPDEFGAMFRADRDRHVDEALCLLYVAVTRAVHALHLVLAPSTEKENSVPKTFAGLVRRAILGEAPLSPDRLLLEEGRADWSMPESDTVAPPDSRVPHEPRTAPAAEPVVETIRLRPSTGRRRGFEHATPSGMEGGGRVEADRLLHLDRGPSRARGTLWHAWFEAVGWLEDGAPSQDDLLRIAAKFPTAGLDVPREAAACGRSLRQPGLRALLTRSGLAALLKSEFADAADPELSAALDDPAAPDLRREESFLLRDGPRILSGAIDRLVLFRAGDRIAAADVVDFKTDAPDGPSALADRVAFYRPQIEAYRRSVAQRLRLDPRRIGARLVFPLAGRIVPVPP